MTRWLMRYLPRPSILWLFGVLYLPVIGGDYLLWRYDLTWDEQVISPRALYVLIACGAYGLFRVLKFHAAWCAQYRQWLQTVPWTADRPLPAGSVPLVIQDALVLAILAALAAGTARADPIACAAVLVGCYVAALTVASAFTGVLAEAYVVAFGFGLALRLSDHHVLWPVVLGCLYVVAIIGWKRSIARFPWEASLIEKLHTSPTGPAMWRLQSNRPAAGPRVGFPYDLLKHRTAEPLVPVRHAILLALLATWSLYVILWKEGSDDQTYWAIVQYVMFPLAVAAVRIAVYCGQLWPPISLLGRVATGRLIIPHYDRVLIAPLAAVTLGLIVGLGSMRLGLPHEFAGPAMVFCVVAIALGAGPTLGHWRLMGQYRTITPMPAADLIKL